MFVNLVKAETYADWEVDIDPATGLGDRLGSNGGEVVDSCYDARVSLPNADYPFPIVDTFFSSVCRLDSRGVFNFLGIGDRKAGSADILWGEFLVLITD